MVREEIERSALATRVRSLQSALDGKSISERRTISTTMPVGVNSFAFDFSGVPVAEGVIGLMITPTTHNTFTWYVHHTVGLVINNTGVAQTFTATYYVIG